MAIYECLFFKDGRVAYWENLEAGSDISIETFLLAMLADADWDAAEAWRDNVLKCQVTRPQ